MPPSSSKRGNNCGDGTYQGIGKRPKYSHEEQWFLDQECLSPFQSNGTDDLHYSIGDSLTTSPVPTAADSDANFRMIKSWLERCSKNHELCNKTRASTSDFVLPTRLIDVNPDGRNSDVKLVQSETIDSPKECRYVALSHCWGDSTTVPQTTKTNINHHLEYIPQDNLSKTFQDAVVITRRLNIRYLWIDSLCIIQQDTGDFEHECSIMHHIYARSFITICASDSENGSGGCFLSRDSAEQLDASDVFGMFERTDAWIKLLSGPLSTRGWTLQELELSPRVIHYTRQQILWECRICVAAEATPDLRHRSVTGRFSDFNSRNPSLWRILDGRLESLWTHPTHIISFYNADALLFRWLRTMQQYSRRRLSRESDKLPAISGLSASFSTLLSRSDYFAGIWGHDTLGGLCWYPQESITGPWPPSVVDSIPSWSWASYPGEVCFLDLKPDLIGVNKETRERKRGIVHAEKICEYLKVETLIRGVDPFGRVKGGTLTIRAPAREIGYEDRVWEWPSQVTIHKATKATIHYAYDTFPDPKPQDQKLLCVVLASYQSNYWGLVLLAIGDEIYNRVGSFRMGITSSFKNADCWRTVTII